MRLPPWFSVLSSAPPDAIMKSGQTRHSPAALLPPLATTALMWEMLPGIASHASQKAWFGEWQISWDQLYAGIGDFQIPGLFGAFWVGLFIQGVLARFRPGRRIFVWLAVLACLGLSRVILDVPTDGSSSGWGVPANLSSALVGFALGSFLGMILSRRFLSDLMLDEQGVRRIWPWLAAMPFVLAIIPIDNSSSLANLVFSDFIALPQRIYQVIKAMILWLPIGLILSVAGYGRAAKVWGMVGVVTLALVLNVSLLTIPWWNLMALLAALPGLAAGIWLLEHGGFSNEKSIVRDGRVSAKLVADRGKEPPRPPKKISVTQDPSVSANISSPPRAWLSVSPLAMAIGALILVCVGVLSMDFPRWNWALAAGLVLYAAGIWWRPLSWMVIVPALLPVLDLAPWTGRFFLDEFDLLIAVTLGILLLRGRSGPPLSWPRLTRLFLFLYFALALTSCLIGLRGVPALDANAFSSYWSPYNSLRVAKGMVWGGVLLFLVWRTCTDTKKVTRLLAIGMALGLTVVSLIGVWERWLYAGLTDSGSSYRIVGLFSSMHTGGGHIEAYMAASIPFLWLGLGRLRTLAVVAPIMVLATYVLIFTVSRGGALAFGLVLLILIAGNARLGFLSGSRRGFVAPFLVLSVVAGILIVGLGGSYFQQRLSSTAQDGETRYEHWRQALGMMDDTWSARLFGMGLGSFPRVFLERGAQSDRPGTYGFVTSRTGMALRLGSGATLYFSQRVPIEAATRYRLIVDARASGGDSQLDTPICEKQMLNSRRCTWSRIDIPGDAQWRRFERTIDSGELGKGSFLSHLPTEFVLTNASKTGLLEIDNVRLLDENGRDQLCNGNFEKGADCWFFKTHSHLPWHIKNIFVHIVFEQGWLGLAAFLSLAGLSLSRLTRAAWQGQTLAWVLLASLAGMFTVGLFDSILDAPRIALLLTGFLFLGAAPPWSFKVKPSKRRRRHRHDEAASRSAASFRESPI